MARTILIIEDEQHIVDILKFNLQKEGYETHVYEARAFVWNALGGLTPVTNVTSIESIY